MKIANLYKALTLSALAFVVPAPAAAVTLDDAAVELDQSFAAFMAGGIGRSSDKNPPNFLAAFKAFVDPDFLKFGAFDGPLNVSGGLALEVAGYAGRNAFGVLDETNKFTTLLSGSAKPGATFSTNLDDGSYRFALNSPDGLFSSIASQNLDSYLHIVGQQVIKSGFVTGWGLAINVLAGDYVLYMEDLRGGGDKDYNDSVVVVRATNLDCTPGEPVPEPATMLLLSSGLFGIRAMRKRKAE